MSKQLIAADIGGTSSRFAHFVLAENFTLMKNSAAYLATADYSSFEALLDGAAPSVLGIELSAADLCIFALPGPIDGGLFCRPPNISWTVDLRSSSVQERIGRFLLINDFLAQAYSCLSPLAREAKLVLPGHAQGQSTIAVLGPGTGLGKAILVPDGRGGYLGIPSEGGHGNFCPETQEELSFAAFVAKHEGSGYATWDDVVSGRGLSYVHEFLTGEHISPAAVSAKLDSAGETMRWFTRFCARVCRNFALDTLSRGGVYVVGGAAAKNPAIFSHPAFSAEFRASPVHAELLSQIPVSLIENQESGLWGAAYYGARLLAEENN